MHDKHGTPLQDGDFVKHETWINGGKRVIVAEVVRSNPAADSCNLTLAVPYATVAVREETATARLVEKVDVSTPST